MNTVEKAGAIVLKEEKGENYILLLFRDKYKDWTFTKGHIEEGENTTQAAIREVKEETGLDITLTIQLPKLQYVLPKGDLANVHMFLGATSNPELLCAESEGDKLEWFSISEATEKLTDSTMKEYFKKIINYIKNKSVEEPLSTSSKAEQDVQYFL